MTNVTKNPNEKLITDYTDGSLYFNRRPIRQQEVSENAVPSYPIFAMAKGEETIVYDVRKFSHLSQQRLIDGLNSGIITNEDKIILSLIATFSAVAITTKMVTELLTLMGNTSDDLRKKVDSSVHRLWRYALVDFYHYKDIESEKQCFTRMIALTPTGFRVVKSMGLQTFFYNAIEFSSRTVAEHKRNAAGAQCLVAWIQHFPLQSFSLRRNVNFLDENKEAIVRPTVTIVAGEGDRTETLYLEAVRRNAGYEVELLNKMRRYELVSYYMEQAHNDKPTIIIVAEDQEHSRDIFEYLTAGGIKAEELVFTHDLKVASDQFYTAFYCYNEGGMVPLQLKRK